MKSLLAVFAGGVLGTATRLLVDHAIPHGDTVFPLSTLIINVVGSALLGFLVARVWPTAAPWLRAGLGAGVLGSFTTFSAVVVAVVTLSAGDRMLLAVLYLALSLVLGFTAAAAGLRIGGSAVLRSSDSAVLPSSDSAALPSSDSAALRMGASLDSDSRPSADAGTSASPDPRTPSAQPDQQEDQ